MNDLKSGVDLINPMVEMENNQEANVAQSMNSEVFSQFSFPSNNFVNGMRVNVP